MRKIRLVLLGVLCAGLLVCGIGTGVTLAAGAVVLLASSAAGSEAWHPGSPPGGAAWASASAACAVPRLPGPPQTPKRHPPPSPGSAASAPGLPWVSGDWAAS